MKGPKRHLLVDVEGFLLQVLVHRADIQERAGAKLLLEKLNFPTRRLKLIWADAGYWGKDFGDWIQENCRCRLEIVSANELINRRQGRQGYVPLPRRWVVERSFAWLGRYRRLSKDYEQNTASSQTWIKLAFCSLMLKRLN